MSTPINRYAYAVALASGLLGLGVVSGVITFGSAPILLTALSIFALAAAIVGLFRAVDRPETPPTPTPERRLQAPVPNLSPEAAYREFGERGGSESSHAARLGLRAVARETLRRYHGLDTDGATRALDAGTWTDDPDVATYLSDESDESNNYRPSVLETIRGADKRTMIRARAIREIAAIPRRLQSDRIEATPATERDSGRDEPEPASTERTRTTDLQLSRLHALNRFETGHWWGVGAIALTAIGAGILFESPGLLLAGTAAIGYAGYARSTTVPEPTLSVDRTIEPETPDPGASVTVRTTVTNEGPRPLVDVRVIDGVPGPLEVEDGSCRAGTTLFSGDSITVEYTVTASPGTHEFDPTMVIVGGASRSAEQPVLVPEPTTITCAPTRDPTTSTVPQHQAALRRTGHLRTDDGGAGTDFHSIREYQIGDPINRIDWNRHARTGELATIRFHKMEATRVLLVVDARREAYAAPSDAAAIHAVDRSVDAAGRIAADVIAAGDSVGLAAIGPPSRRDGATETDPSLEEKQCWIPPATGPDHELRIQRALTSHPQFSTIPAPESRRWLTQLGKLKKHLQGEMEIVLFTPLTDFGSSLLARRLATLGHPVTIISPDPTTTETPERELASHCRSLRRTSLQRNGMTVIDWDADESLDVVLEREAKRRPNQ